MEIEKLIKHMREEAQDYRSGRTLGRAFADAEDVLDEAATALEQLQAENDRLHDELEKVDAERDAAVNDLNILRKRSGWKCYACFYDDHYDRGVCAGCGYNNDNNWQWRGQKED